MTLAGYKLSKKQVLVGIILIVGFFVLFYLIKQQQIFKGKAEVNPSTAFTFESGDGGQVEKTGETSYKTNTQHIKIKLNPSILNQ